MKAWHALVFLFCAMLILPITAIATAQPACPDGSCGQLGLPPVAPPASRFTLTPAFRAGKALVFIAKDTTTNNEYFVYSEHLRIEPLDEKEGAK